VENKTVEMVVKDLLLADNRKKRRKSPFDKQINVKICITTVNHSIEVTA